MVNPVNNPPALFLAFFRWFAHPDYREDIEGDLLERFNTRVTKLGIRKAKWLFIKDVFLLFGPGIVMNLEIMLQNNLFNMKKLNWTRFIAVNLLFIVVILLPFFPGPPNKLVIGLSILGQSAGFFGLLVVPIGLAWVIMEIKKLKKGNYTTRDWRPSYYFAITAALIAAAIYILLLIAVFLNFGYLPGLLLIIPMLFGSGQALKGIRKLRNNPGRKLNPLPFYLLTIPLLALITNSLLLRPVSSYSRSYAIKKCESLISSIEEYKDKKGKYPESVQDLEAGYMKKIPSPSIMGILNFRYNKINDQYSVSFSQWLHLGSLEEIVLYDKTNLRNRLEGEFAKYDYGFDLCRIKGAFEIHDTIHENWRYYLID